MWWHSLSLCCVAGWMFSLLMSLLAGRGHPREGSCRPLPRGIWRTSWRSGTLGELSSPLFTPADPACWACVDTSPLFLVLCSRGGHVTQCRESCCTQPGLFHQPKAAWTETESASKQSTHLFTANYFPESWPSRTTWRTCLAFTDIRAGSSTQTERY